MSAGSVTVRRAGDGSWRVLLEVDASFSSAEAADSAAHYLAAHARVRLADVLRHLQAAAGEPPW